jgi:hypothetical protein
MRENRDCDPQVLSRERESGPRHWKLCKGYAVVIVAQTRASWWVMLPGGFVVLGLHPLTQVRIGCRILPMSKGVIGDTRCITMNFSIPEDVAAKFNRAIENRENYGTSRSVVLVRLVMDYLAAPANGSRRARR